MFETDYGICKNNWCSEIKQLFENVNKIDIYHNKHTMTITMTMIKKIIVSSGFNIFNTFINLYEKGFMLNHRSPYIIS